MHQFYGFVPVQKPDIHGGALQYFAELCADDLEKIIHFTSGRERLFQIVELGESAEGSQDRLPLILIVLRGDKSGSGDFRKGPHFVQVTFIEGRLEGDNFNSAGELFVLSE